MNTNNKLTNGKGSDKDIFLSMILKMDDKIHNKYNLPTSLECSDSRIAELNIVTCYVENTNTKVSVNNLVSVFNESFEELNQLALLESIVRIYDHFLNSHFLAEIYWLNNSTKKADDSPKLIINIPGTEKTYTVLQREDGAAYVLVPNTNSFQGYIHFFLPTEPKSVYDFDFNTENFWDFSQFEVDVPIGELSNVGTIYKLDENLNAYAGEIETLTDIHFTHNGFSIIVFPEKINEKFFISLEEYPVPEK